MVFLIWVCPAIVMAQSPDSVISISTFEVVSPRVTLQEQTFKTERVDSLERVAYQHAHLADLLSNTGHLFIKTYGMGGLATTSFRGGNASHTAVLWNNLNINSPFNGLLDLSLIPVSFFSDVSLQYGGSSGLWGSGAVSGSIQLGNSHSFDSTFSAQAGITMGSFQKQAYTAGAKWSSTTYSGTIKAFYHLAENDFRFLDTRDSSFENQTNASFLSSGLLSEHKWRLPKGKTLTLASWLQHTDRNIPPTLFESQSDASQLDQTLKLNGTLFLPHNDLKTFIRVGYFFDELIFQNPTTQLYSFNQSQVAVAEVEGTYAISTQQQVLFGVNHTGSFAKADGYNLTPGNWVSQQRTDIYGGYQFQALNYRLQGNFSVRQSVVDRQLKPFVYSFGANYQVLSSLRIYANHARVYLIPTLNDRFWVPGGNPNLGAESGLTQEVGVSWKESWRNLEVEHKSSLYTRDMQNMILWLPQAGIWTPRNVVSVWSSGLETSSSVYYSNEKLWVKLSVFTNYAPSSFQSAVTENDASEGKQLPYTPMYSGHGSLTFGFAFFSLSYLHHYVGYRYLSNDNYQYLHPYQLGQIRLSARKTVSEKNALSAFVQVNNLWRETYQVIANRPMPLTNVDFGVTYSFSKYDLL